MSQSTKVTVTCDVCNKEVTNTALMATQTIGVDLPGMSHIDFNFTARRGKELIDVHRECFITLIKSVALYLDERAFMGTHPETIRVKELAK